MSGGSVAGSGSTHIEMPREKKNFIRDQLISSSFTVANGMRVFFASCFDPVFIVQGGYMTLGSTLPAPINRFAIH